LDGGLSPAAPPVAVRPARPDDLAFVLGLAARFAETRPAWRTEREVTEGTKAELRRAFEAPAPGSAVFVAEDAAGAPLGFAYGVLHDDFFTGEAHGHVSEIAVARDGSGAAAPLVAAVEAHFRGLGVRFTTLNVNLANERARRLYERLGYGPQFTQFVKVL
jgi:ribosomal protein S18 acetylase RimI-like enzyme